MVSEKDVGSSSTAGDDEKKEKWKGKEILSVNDSGLKTKRSRQLRWTDAMDKALIKLLVDQIAVGNMVDKSFKPTAYRSVCRHMQEKFGVEMRTAHIKSRMRTLKPVYSEARKLLGMSGFSWNEAKNQIQADPGVWEEYIKEHPSAAIVKGRVMEMYDMMQVILGNDKASDIAPTVPELLEEEDEEGDDDGTDVKCGDEIATPITVNNVDGDINGSQTHSTTRGGSVWASPTKKNAHRTKKRGQNEFIAAISRMNETMSKIASALTVQSEQDFFDRLWHEVMAVEGFPSDTLNAVFGYLGHNEKEARIFLARNKTYRAQMVNRIVSKIPGIAYPGMTFPCL
ncbi:PREDICTED: uncharacterized protein At2g29880-like [Nelumbo nucifera]|uniref:Uncharacterized protein At2g29880-like n=2 Tax=Nelumbo nucifera TaxID=4432 RepID=A0A1U8BK35_NELNU|nr:PREDICTED: uncharacterized protein At2g29880-like [Nelumbo nucifera]XP_010277196.1 PREDICTED: uncharacterized protein At2g29880-like [Nelumbo nucifera]DAD46029.1 TPA_asm: hypothetical protein HUJ06_004259 [Nelumbo nucifera]